jgi:hypothetical protein
VRRRAHAQKVLWIKYVQILSQHLVCLFSLCSHFLHQPIMNSLVICLPIGGLLIEIGCLKIAGQFFANKLYYPGTSILANAVNGILIDPYPVAMSTEYSCPQYWKDDRHAPHSLSFFYWLT